MNKYIEYIKVMNQDENVDVDDEMYANLLNDFKIKLETWLMEKPRFSDDFDFNEMQDAIKYINNELSLNVA